VKSSEHCGVDIAQFRPWGGDLHRVDHETLLRERLQTARVVTVGEPVVDALLGCRDRAVRAGATVDDGERRVDDFLFAVVEHDERARRAVPAVAALRLGRVVEAQHRRRGVRTDALAHRGDARGECGEEIRGLLSHRRHVVGAQPCARDDAERAFAADEHRRHIGPVRGGWGPACADHRAIGHHHFDTDDHLVDFSVTSGELPGAQAGDPTADGGNVE